MKTHFATGPDTRGTQTSSACGRGTRTTENVFSVSCLLCMNSDVFASTLAVAKAARETAFNTQEPRTIVPQFGRVNDDGVMECYQCKGVLFRERPRSLWSYHYVCAECGTSMHPMTETGMST